LSKYKRKYRKGVKVMSLWFLVTWLGIGNNIYVRDQFVPNGWAMSWQLFYAKRLVDSGVVCYAHRIEEVKNDAD
jgi:hypothetical protein